MLVVVPDVEGYPVEGPVVRVGLETLSEHVVLGDEMARDRVQSHGQQRTAQQVDENLRSWNGNESFARCAYKVYVYKCGPSVGRVYYRNTRKRNSRTPAERRD